ncbi:MAG TPA: YceI family protein [Rhodanobacteraceae bacterium]
MRRTHHVAAAAAGSDSTAGSGGATGAVTYTMDPGHTEVLATWNHFGFSKPAAMFYQVRGSITYDPARPEAASVEVTIPVASLHTTVPKQDAHLQSAEFFDAEKFPDIHFVSTRVARGAAPGKLQVTGDLRVHGVTRPVTLDVTVNQVGNHPMHNVQAAGFDAVAHLNRSDFGVGAHVPLVSDRIDLRITTEAVESTAWEVIRRQFE